ncbi:ParA family protein [Frigoriglobus tundricola]|nr:AAA family ATPase [Frigoriglobus tundricola]
MLNRKGGVGKSSACFNLGGSFARAGQRVLLIDMDPQASLTQGFFGSQAMEAADPKDTIVALFDDRCDPDPSRIIRATAFERLFIASGSNALDRHNVPEPEAAGEYQRTLRALPDIPRWPRSKTKPRPLTVSASAANWPRTRRGLRGDSGRCQAVA